eukprot:gene43761-55019_t
MPLSPVTAALFDLSYVQQQFPVLAARAKATPALDPVCSANAQCKAQGLDGACCPTTDGVFLGCCQTGTSTMDEWRAYTLADLASKYTVRTEATLQSGRAFDPFVRAVLDKNAAWDLALSLPNFGPGNSRANVLFWAASRPPPQTNFDLAAVATANATGRNMTLKSACAVNSACDALGTFV